VSTGALSVLLIHLLAGVAGAQTKSHPTRAEMRTATDVPDAITPLTDVVARVPLTEISRRRVKVTGTVTGHDGHRALYITDTEGEHHLEVRPAEATSVVPGDVIEAVGLVRGTSTTRLVDAIVRRIGSTQPPAPIRVDAARLLAGDYGSALVTVEGTLVRHGVDANDYELVLRSGAITFEASLPADGTPSMAELLPGSLLEVSGIAELRSSGRQQPASFEILLRSVHDIHVPARPSWWTPRRALYVSAFILIGFVTSAGWVVALRRRIPAIERARFHAEAALKERDAQLHQSQKMEAIGRLAGGLAHDFNNILTVIAGNVDFAINAARSNQRVPAEFLKEIQEATRSATGLTRQLLAFSSRQLIEPRLLDVNAVVTEFEKMLHRLIGEDVQLALKTYPEPLFVYADRAQLEQVLVNLAVNARDAMPDGGTLLVETAVDGSIVLLAISDTGVGIDKDVIGHIFEPFFTTKGPGRGTGLGLAMVYGAVTQSGGTIHVQSDVGRGTTFRITPPRVAAQLQQPPPRRRRSTQSSSGRV
jgi:signal transduction histidine kinase